jgi:hypothetical protein
VSTRKSYQKGPELRDSLRKKENNISARGGRISTGPALKKQVIGQSYSRSVSKPFTFDLKADILLIGNNIVRQDYFIG